MAYKFRKYSPQYHSSLTRLLDNSFKINNHDKEKAVNWKLFDDYHQDHTITYLALDDIDEVVCHYTNLPVGVVGRGKSYRAMICSDMATDKRHRGQRLISNLSKRVYEEVNKQERDFSIGFSNDQGVKVDKNSRNYGYSVVGRFVRYSKIIFYKKKTDLKLVKVESFDKNWMFNGSIPYLRVKKTAEYLDWRYFRKPNNDYLKYEVYLNINMVGYVVLRFLNGRCYVHDVITNNISKEFMGEVLKSIDNIALKNKARLIIYNVLDNKFWKGVFNKFIFLKKVNNGVNYHLTIKIHKDNIPIKYLLNKEHWLLMNGDIL